MFKALIASSLFIIPVISHAQGGSVGGGLAVRCGQEPLQMIDTRFPEVKTRVEIAKAMAKVSHDTFESRIELRKRIRERLEPVDAALSSEILSLYDDYEDSDTWPNDTLKGTYDAFMPVVLPSDCVIVQAAYFSEVGKPKKLKAWKELGASQRRVLELHEPIYSLAARKYKHTNPVLSRYLVSLIIRTDASSEELKAAVQRFRNPGKTRYISGSYVSAGFSQMKFGKTENDFLGDSKLVSESPWSAACPAFMVLENTGLNGSQLAFFDRDGQKKPYPRGFSLRTPFSSGLALKIEFNELHLKILGGQTTSPVRTYRGNWLTSGVVMVDYKNGLCEYLLEQPNADNSDSATSKIFRASDRALIDEFIHHGLALSSTKSRFTGSKVKVKIHQPWHDKRGLFLKPDRVEELE